MEFPKITNNTYIIIVVAIVVAVIAIIVISSVLYNTKGNAEQYTNADRRGLPVRPAGKITLYYASWCGHSKQFMPEWNKFVKYTNQYMPYIQVDTIECKEDNKEACKDVQGFPTIMLINQQNKQILYEGERTLEGLIKFVNNRL